MTRSATSATKAILEILLELGKAPLEAFFPYKYSYCRPSRRLLGLDSYPKVSPPTVSAILSRLKKQGLVEKHGGRRRSSWSLTKNGLVKAKKIQELHNQELLAEDGIPRLVIFDIPEKQRKKRDRMRAELVSCNFKQLQKSVWLGYNPLPINFIELIDDLSLENKVHIFSIAKSGTLEEKMQK